MTQFEIIRVLAAGMNNQSDPNTFRSVPCLRVSGLRLHTPTPYTPIYTFFSTRWMDVVCIMPPSLRKLPCPHPDCPSTFKSQHGRTKHIRAAHLNTHQRRDRVGMAQDYEEEHVEYNAPPSPPDTRNTTPLPPFLEKKEHPQLTGMSQSTCT